MLFSLFIKIIILLL